MEAGLRTGDLKAPLPKEANRSLVGSLASLNFTPTLKPRKHSWITKVCARYCDAGNTLIDALLLTKEHNKTIEKTAWKHIFGESIFTKINNQYEKIALITGHRRENFGKGFTDFCSAIKTLAKKYPEFLFLYPVHLNLQVQKPVKEIVSDLDSVSLIDNVSHQTFVWLMDQSKIILTNSGGIQEEGPSLGKPVLVMREVTERPEAVDAGTVELVGTDPKTIIENC